jgi:hypothetical protein
MTSEVAVIACARLLEQVLGVEHAARGALAVARQNS